MSSKRTFETSGAETAPTFWNTVERDRRGMAAGLADVSRKAWAGLSRWHQQRQTYDALTRCSDRVLADIGFEREDIPLIARGIDPQAYETMPARWSRRWRALRERLDAARRARREWRRIRRELMDYDDRELDQIGIRRSDIGRIAKGQAAAVPAQ